MTTMRDKVRSGTPLIGSFAAIPHPVAVEVLAGTDHDFICIDCEHAQIGRERLEDLVRASDSQGIPALVRVPGNVPEAIASALDAGAAGVLIPRVSTAAEARAAAAAARYPPEGKRGAGPGRAAGYGYDVFGYVGQANASLALAVQVETRDGVINIDEIAAIEEIDAIFIGPGDLAISLGAAGRDGQAQLDEAITLIIAACKKAGRAIGLFRPTADDIDLWRGKGISLFIVASDAMLLRAAAVASISSAKRKIDAG